MPIVEFSRLDYEKESTLHFRLVDWYAIALLPSCDSHHSANSLSVFTTNGSNWISSSPDPLYCSLIPSHCDRCGSAN
ncbi:MAG: hypothetical protein CMI29_09145 [Opitutae bacterium]|nr:hypothetical protein [Opitutae bacterium]